MSDDRRNDSTATGWSTKTKLIMTTVAVGALVIAYVFAVTVIPRWWAQRIGNAVEGRISFGSMLGFVIGLVFTLVPLGILMLAWKYRGSWKRWLVYICVAAIAASPNLATIGISIGNGSAARAGQRTLDVDGPGFRGGTYVGMVIGAAAMLAVGWLLRSRRQAKSRLRSPTP